MRFKMSNNISQEASLREYIRDISKFPILAEEQEYELIRKYQQDGNKDAGHQVINSHLRLVVKMAMAYKGYGLPMVDLVSEGNLGLLQALNKFELEKGYRFSTYAMWWVKAFINDHILKFWSVMKIGSSSNQRKLFFNLRKLKAKLGADGDNGELKEGFSAEIASKLNVKESEVKEMNGFLTAPAVSLNKAVYDDSEAEHIDLIEDTSQSQELELANKQEATQRQSMLYKAMRGLNQREKDILIKRRLIERPVTLDDLSKAYKVSRERIRQIEAKAFEKIQKVILSSRLKGA